MTKSLPFTLIIPAHNEEAVIKRCLKTALSGAPDDGSLEVIVAANGCNDRTVEEARLAAPGAKVLDLSEGSKTAAINAANRAASHFPRIILDADIECSYNSLAAMAGVLTEPGVMTAAPAIKLDLAHCNWFMKAYYAAWIEQPYANAGKGGAGCYGLSQSALETVGEFPPIIGDDIWIHTRFSDAQKRLVKNDARGDAVFSIVRPPSNASTQIKVEARRQIGNAEVRRDYPSPHLPVRGGGGGIAASLRKGVSPVNLAVFFAIKLLARLKARIDTFSGGGNIWTRDQTSRSVQ